MLFFNLKTKSLIIFHSLKIYLKHFVKLFEACLTKVFNKLDVMFIFFVFRLKFKNQKKYLF
jgi:hypothetical protein